MANHAEKEWEWNGELYKCKPGQFITSLEGLRQSCAKQTTIRNVRTALNKLEKWRFLTNKSTKSGRVITICNWVIYQSDAKTDNETAKQVTKKRQSTDKEVTTNKKDKNVKNEKKKIKYAEFVSMTRHEYEKLVQQYGEGDTKKMISKLDNYKGAHAKTYDSDYRAILNWVAGEVQNGRPGKNMVVF